MGSDAISACKALQQMEKNIEEQCAARVDRPAALEAFDVFGFSSHHFSSVQGLFVQDALSSSEMF